MTLTVVASQGSKFVHTQIKLVSLVIKILTVVVVTVIIQYVINMNAKSVQRIVIVKIKLGLVKTV